MLDYSQRPVRFLEVIPVPVAAESVIGFALPQAGMSSEQSIHGVGI
jgi:hypothetical protein